MKSTITLLLGLFFSITIIAQNIEQIAHVPLPENGNDVWGYVDSNGTEYAIVGSIAATYVYSLEDPSNPILRKTVQGAVGLWRDMKSYKDYVYVVADQGQDGLLIMDMSQAPEVINHRFFRPLELVVGNELGPLNKCHNLYIDEQGIAYLAGCNLGNSGVLMFDLNPDPESPVLVGVQDNFYAHDVFVRNDTMITSDINNQSFSIYDISDKSNPILRATQTTGTFFTHNAWMSDDGKTLYTTDERPNAYVEAYDISDFDNIKFLSRYQPVFGGGVVPHNAHFLNDYLYVSWYSQGSIILDVTDPTNMVKVGQFRNGGSTDHWGAYPYLPSGLLLASDINTGLYILQPQLQRASFLEGLVTANNEDQAPINGASIKIVSGENVSTISDINGNYKTGLGGSGTFMVEVSHPEFFNSTMEVEMVEGQVTTANFQLDSRKEYTITGRIEDMITGAGIPKAGLVLENENFQFDVQTDDSGAFSLNLLEGEYSLISGAWGYKEMTVEATNYSSDQELVLQLVPGYEDGFAIDQGWTRGGTASRGLWERGIPIPTVWNGLFSNVPNDIEGDNGFSCYITGNGGGGAGSDDVDGGTTYIESPAIDLSDYTDPILSYAIYFFNRSGNTTPDDYMRIRVSNQNEVVYIDTLYGIEDSGSDWKDIRSFNLKDYIDITDEMYIRVEIADQGPGHLVEGGFDAFSIVEGGSSIEEQLVDIELKLYPSPAVDRFELDINGEDIFPLNVEIYDIDGRLQANGRVKQSGVTSWDVTSLQAGNYIVKVNSYDGKYLTRKLSIVK